MSEEEDAFCNRAEVRQALDDHPQNPDIGETIGDVINARYHRRDVVRGMLGVAAISSFLGPAMLIAGCSDDEADAGAFHFEELEAGVDETHHVAEDYEAQILLRWGDPVFEDAPPFDPRRQSAAAQLRQFGYNNDYVGFIPLDDDGDRGLLCVNHEYTNEEVMFPQIPVQDSKDTDFKDMSAVLAEVEMAAHGGTIIEIERDGDEWEPVLDSRHNRRISPLHTKMVLDGPAAGDDRLKTSADPSGRAVIGTLNNCAGGITAWNTYLMAEENFRFYFWQDELAKPKEVCAGKEAESAKRYGLGERRQAWGKFTDNENLRRFNLAAEPNEPNRFGWIVEVDPFDPQSVPVKHTALGRFCHEGAESIVNKDGRVVLYSGDDTRFEYVYRFVSSGKFNPEDRGGNMRLLSEGTLSVAKFAADGTVTWLPLVFGEGPLTEANGFKSQADVLIDARLAADRLGATCMDRPEDVEPNPKTGSVYVILTNNKKRGEAETDPANPRADNLFGHIIEMIPPDGDHAAATFKWNILVKCGPKSGAGASWHAETSESGWFASPDNCAVDTEGRLWVATDQGDEWPLTKRADGLYAVETGNKRGKSKLFFRCPVGAELCGPAFTPDGETLFVAVQHPGTDGTKAYERFGRASTFEDPATRWPDFDERMPPRPSVLAIRRRGGGKIGS
ncbi:MAG TPA: PhoX family phosphatase [Hyphomicrobium sp.]